MKPLYVKVESCELTNTLTEVEEHIRDIQRLTGFLIAKSPILVPIGETKNDHIAVGNMVVYGISKLSDDQKMELIKLLESFC